MGGTSSAARPPPARESARRDGAERGMAEKCYDPSDRSFVFVDGPDDLDYCCDEFKSLRARMSCGHNVTPSSLTKWCRIMLDQSNNTFTCGDCRAKWSYPEVRKMALLTQSEREEFEEKMSRIAARDDCQCKSCPGCGSTVRRKDPTSLNVRCRMCSVSKQRNYEFCWQCLGEWRGERPRTDRLQSDRCANDGCANEALTTLATCGDVVFESVRVSGCPAIRACPTCGALLKHSSKNCKNIVCPRCRVEFCFVCLKRSVECQKTSSFNNPCSGGIAPRQTVIPWWDKK